MPHQTHTDATTEDVARVIASEFFVNSEVATGVLGLITKSGTHYLFTVREGYTEQVRLTKSGLLCDVRRAWAVQNGCSMPDVTHVAYHSRTGLFVLLDDDLNEIRITTGVREVLLRKIEKMRP